MTQHEDVYEQAVFRTALLVMGLANVGYGGEDVEVLVDEGQNVVVVRLTAEEKQWQVVVAHVEDGAEFGKRWTARQQELPQQLQALSQTHPTDCILDFSVGALGQALMTLGFKCPRMKMADVPQEGMSVIPSKDPAVKA